MGTYQYESLHFEDEIRILHISRSHMPLSKALRFSIERAFLSRRPRYEALSYVWGGSERCRTITETHSRKIFFITENCFSALYNLCYEGKRQLFVDQICIDQDNIHERNKQVALMSRVYMQASRTIIYLGAPDVHSNYIMRYQKSGTYDKNSDRFKTNPTRSYFPRPTTAATFQGSEYDHLSALLKRPWFRRTWTIQESLLAPDNVVRIGKREIEWSFLTHEIRRLWPTSGLSGWKEPSEMALFYGRHITLNPAIWCPDSDQWRTVERLPYEALFRVMCLTAERECADPRDKLFALISLFHGDLPPMLRPDYSRSLLDVYAGITRHAFEALDRSEPCDVVLTKATGLSEQTSLLPTWTIDWRRLPWDWKLMDDRAKRAKYTENKDGHLQGLHLSFPSEDRLRVRGICLGKVESVAVDRYLRAGITKLDDLSGVPMTFSIDPKKFRSQFKYELPTCKPFKARARKETSKGDHVCLLLGFTLPYVLRKNASTWKLVGECLPWDWDYDRGAFDDDHLIAKFMKTLRTSIGRMSTVEYTKSPLFPCEDFEIV